MQKTTTQSHNHGYTLLEMLFVVVLIGLFMLIAYQQIQQSTYRRNLATLNGSINTLQYAITQYYYANCADIYTRTTTNPSLSDLNQYYPSGNATVANPFNTSNPQSFTFTITRASKVAATTTVPAYGIATKVTIETTFPGMSSDQINQIAASVRPTAYDENAKTMSWTFSPFRTIASTGLSQSSRASLAVYNIWSSSAQGIQSTQQSCDYWEYTYQTQ